MTKYSVAKRKDGWHVIDSEGFDVSYVGYDTKREAVESARVYATGGYRREERGRLMATFTKREITVLSSPACHPRYTMTVPAGTPVEIVKRTPRRTDYAVAPEGFHKVKGSNPHDLKHYYVWLDPADVERSA